MMQDALPSSWPDGQHSPPWLARHMAAEGSEQLTACEHVSWLCGRLSAGNGVLQSAAAEVGCAPSHLPAAHSAPRRLGPPPLPAAASAQPPARQQTTLIARRRACRIPPACLQHSGSRICIEVARIEEAKKQSACACAILMSRVRAMLRTQARALLHQQEAGWAAIPGRRRLHTHLRSQAGAGAPGGALCVLHRAHALGQQRRSLGRRRGIRLHLHRFAKPLTARQPCDQPACAPTTPLLLAA